MRRLLLIAALALLLAPAAAAKEITAVQVCGTAGCSDVALPKGLHGFSGGGGSSAPPPAGPFVEVELIFDGMHTETVWYVPGARLFAVSDGTGWIRWAQPAAQRLDRLIADAAAGVAPHRPRVTEAYVDGKRVEGDVSGYLALFAPGPNAGGRETGEGFAAVSLTTQPPSPWAVTRLWFYPEHGLLQRGHVTVQLPPHVADALREGGPIGTRGSDSGFDWPLVSGSLLVALALALGAAALTRRRPEAAI